MIRLKYYLVLSLLLFPSCFYGQFFKRLGMKDGLSNPSVLAIYQDTLGRMWFGTNEGVNIYDGKQIHQCKSYVVGQSQQVKLINGSINQIVGDSLGNIYIRNNHALLRYDIRNEKLEEIRSSRVSSVASINRKIWCAMGDSLFKYDCNRDSLHFFRKLNTSTIWCLEKQGEKLWIGTSKGLYVLENDLVKCVLPKIEIFRLFVSSHNELWVASRMKGLYRINQEGEIRKEEHSSTRVVSEQIRGFVEDDKQNIWFGTFDGLQVYNPYLDTYSVYRPGYILGALEHQSVFSLYKDNQGTIWIGTYYGGVNYFNQSKDVFHYYPYKKISEGGLSFPIVGQMVEDKDHNLWICTDGGGVNCLNRKNKTFTYYMASGGNSIIHNNVKSITYDKKRDHVYIGTYTGGLSRYDRKSGKFHNYLEAFERIGKGPGQIIYHVLFKDGWLYVSARNGFWRMNPDTNEFQILDNEKLFLTFEIDKQGYIWLTTGFELYKIKVDGGKRLEVKQMTERKVKITKIMEASDGTIYISTLGNGVYVYNYDKEKWSHHTVESDNLLSDFCYNIVETPNNNILLSSDKGLSIYSSFNHSIYSIELGLRGGISAVAEGCGLWAATDGQIYVGGVDGMISFREEDLYVENETVPRLYFSELLINDVRIDPGDDSEVLEEALPFTGKLDLSYKQNNLAILFSSSNYVEHERNVRFFYKLEGFDDDWKSTEQLRLKYTNLPSGNYVLKVRELKNKMQGGEYNEIALTIKIHRPWFATWGAFIFYFIIVSFILYGIWRVIAKRRALALSLVKEKDEKMRIEEMNKMKLRFFTNISHEFRTPLTLIIGQIEMMLQMEKLSPVVTKRIQAVYRNAMNLRILITELLDFRKQEQGFMKLKVECVDVVPFIKDIYRSFVELARRKDITFTFESMDEKIDLWFDPQQMQKVLFNLLSNAFKYTPESGNVKITIKRVRQIVEIAVADTGCGIPNEDLSKIFERFYRGDEVLPDAVQGSGIGLAFTKAMVEAHKGSIKVESVWNEGSCFKIELLTGNSHFTREELDHGRSILSSSDWAEVLKVENLLLQEKQTELVISDIVDKEDEIELKVKPVILLVEDSEEVMELLVSIFSSVYTVYKADNGQAGYEQALRIHPDIVVSDVMMPVMSGKEMCYKIKNCLELAYVPVVLLTAQASDDHTIEGYVFGADAYITKPFNVKLLLACCSNLLKSRRVLLDKVARKEKTMSQETRGLSVSDQRILDTATDIIKRNFDNSDFDMNTLASELHMGRSKMFARIKEVTGLTPNEFALKLKLEEALRMLQEEPQYNISEISYSLGFTSPRYFSRCFKAFYGVSPLTYRKGPEL
ncbi:hybrid sensor histidine kinase/response regulator transcription factor [Bacteroides sp. GM023]|uniref:hybrid sensor histidine kinase/response regulator transcription factor n=1 Tax=Bacteroides sp. GM023 TaxID=2723058 RepID=UPI00168C0DBC|nr:hybrid sensor histidine kinase/response regulator transcription factor [Bacteroides sp. GM023]MBD3588924.1 response regulator [Bacteroides sp. GM023]